MSTELKAPYRSAIESYIQQHARPIDKYSHQPRLYALALQLASSENLVFDDEILHAAVWLHDIGVFAGHRPEDPELLAKWDNVAYACQVLPALLTDWGFPVGKIPAVIYAIEQHAANKSPTTAEAVLLHDADLLELLGAVGIMRALSKVGRDTRYPTHGEAMKVIASACHLPDFLLLPASRSLAEQRLITMKQFMTSLTNETFNVSY